METVGPLRRQREVVEQAAASVPTPGLGPATSDRLCGDARGARDTAGSSAGRGGPSGARNGHAGFQHAIPNIPGKSIIAIVVSYPPGGKTPPHHHARSAFVTGYVLSGSIRSQVDDGKVQVFHAGESWSEAPGAHHPISENASATEPAKLLAIFVVDTDDKELTTLEQQ